MKIKTLNAIKELAITFEGKDLEVSYELMRYIQSNGIDNDFIDDKINEYQLKLDSFSEASKELRDFVDNGLIAVIPIGFRCHTAQEIKKKLGISQVSMPFDNGFFPPNAIANILRNPEINLRFSEENSHRVCIKREKYNDETNGYGIKFESSSYNEIDELVLGKDKKQINSFLDTTFGYYTLDVQHKFVLAHYNWHKLADEKKSKGITNPDINLPRINELLNNRIRRMFKLCNNAEYLFFIFGEFQDYGYIALDDVFYDLKDFSILEGAIKQTFHTPYSILNINDIKSAGDLLSLYKRHSQLERD